MTLEKVQTDAVADDAAEIIERQLHHVPMSQRNPNDIYLIGYPKSGNTWLQNLICSMAFGTHCFYTPDSVVQQLVPDLYVRKFYRRFREPCLFKSHDLPMPDYRRVIYILRDGRDVMVSYRHHWEALLGAPVDMRKLLEYEKIFPCRWADHVETWLANPHRAKLLILRYEDLKTNTAQILPLLCDFIGVERPQDVLSDIAANAQFERMQERERLQGWDHPIWPKDSAFVRRGAIGGYRDEMSPEMQDLFLQQAAGTLLKCGYAI